MGEGSKAKWGILSLLVSSALLAGCTGSQTPLVCDGTVQVVKRPETLRAVQLAALFEKYPPYTKLWGASDGNLKVSEPQYGYFAHLDDTGDSLLIGQDAGSMDGVFNKLTGKLRLALAGELYEVQCRSVRPLVP